MKLTSFLSEGRQITEQGKASSIQNGGLSTTALNRQIRALTPGQTIQGEIVSRNGSEVQIKLSDETVMNAKLEQSLNLEIGKLLTFEIRSNGKALTLSPLFSNMATDINVYRALEMAMLPVSEETVEMTSKMMEAGLSVDRNSLQQVFRELNAFEHSKTEDVVDLHKLGLDVTKDAVLQMEPYKNFSHQLLDGINEMLDAISDTILSLTEDGNIEQAGDILSKLCETTLTVKEETVPTVEGNTASAMQMESVNEAAGETFSQNMVQGNQTEASYAKETSGPIEANLLLDVSFKESDEQGTAALTKLLQHLQDGPHEMTDVSPDVLNKAASLKLSQTEVTNGLSGQESVKGFSDSLQPEGTVFAEDDKITILSNAIDRAMQTEVTEAKDQLSFVQQLLNKALTQKDEVLLKSILQSESPKKILLAQMKELSTITPSELEEQGKVEELYRKMDKLMKGVLKALEGNGQEHTTAHASAENIRSNIDFLQQINQVYAYVQLPVRLLQGEAHGDLYVYTNKKNLASKEGEISALLHLDMEYLGPVDVYVTLNHEKVNTKFYVQDDTMLDFMNAHMDLLTERLKKRGYDMTAQLQRKQSEGDKGTNAKQKKGALAPLFPQSEHAFLLQRLAFDMRA